MGRLCLLANLVLLSLFATAQNDDCNNAINIDIPASGFGLGIFHSDTNSITSATVQAGETFAPAILVAGQNQKSIWYKFTIPTMRSVKVTLAQNGSVITAGDAGFAVYKSSACPPAGASISTKLTPIGLFGSTFHPCVEPGEYMVQVSGKAAANGSVYIILEVAQTIAAYDKQENASQFGAMAAPNFIKYVDFEVECQSIENAEEVCTGLTNSLLYNKSTWHTFTTPSYSDYIALTISNSGAPWYFNSNTSDETFGFNIYAGDARVVPLSSLSLVHGCDSIKSNGYYVGYKTFKCGILQPNTTYSVQIFYKQSFNSNVRLAINFQGTGPTNGPEPVSTLLPASNKLGVLASSFSGVNTMATDRFACNARHSQHPCSPAIPENGVVWNYNNMRYNLSAFFTFTLSTASRLYIRAEDITPPHVLYSNPYMMRVFNGDVTASCGSLDTANMLTPNFLSNWNYSIDCVPAGTYTLQIMGQDTVLPYNYMYPSYLSTPSYFLGLRGDLGREFKVFINTSTRTADNHYNLGQAGAFDTLNLVGGIMQNLTPGVTYLSQIDTFGCANTVLPSDTSCYPGNYKAMYREFNIGDTGMVTLGNYSGMYTKLYFGDASLLSTAQGADTYPERITGLSAVSKCLSSYGCAGNKVCVVPGTYTHVTFGDHTKVGISAQPSVKFDTLGTKFYSPETAEDLGIVDPGSTRTSTADYFSCKDNAVPINGYIPCPIAGIVATKAIYRQFYLSAPSTITISGFHYMACGYTYGPPNTLFYGKASDGISTLTVAEPVMRCFQSATTNGTCTVFPAGWYTVVSYGSGPTATNPFQNIEQYGYSSWVGESSVISITAYAACPGPKYNRPFKAAIDSTTGQPFLVQWGPRVGHTAAYPQTDTTYTLYKENFNCTNDTPFISHTMPVCSQPMTKVAYYVFRTTQSSYVQIDTKNTWGVVYRGNARTDSALFNNSTMLQPCLRSPGFIILNRLPAGVYTLMILNDASQNCTSVQPTIYIDQQGTSRFDFAKNAYDFGIVPPDSVYYKGKVGDVNPLDPLRAPSNDFMYNNTGAAQTDPAEPVCNTSFNPHIYTDSSYLFNQANYNGTSARRNLWYTFQVKEGGMVRLIVSHHTTGKNFWPRFAVYRSNVNGTLPFSDVVSTGQVDSTIAQGLTYVTGNYGYPYCAPYYNSVNFYRDPCNAVTQRYYVLVELPNSYPYDYAGVHPNYQLDVAVLVDSVNAIAPRFDHYYTASDLGSGLTAGTYTGQTDNYSCASGVPADPTWNYSYCATKTLWYKFNVGVTGHVRFNAFINNNPLYQNYYIQLFRQVIPGDSTISGLQMINQSNDAYYDPVLNQSWGQQCVYPGTYYIVLTGCNQLNEYVYPVIKIIEQGGDFCSAPVVAPMAGAGSSTSTVVVNCHTIGTDYGEFNPTLTCPAGATTTDYKTSWFRIDITGADTLDVTTYLTENTNAQSTDIKYRLMNGNCGAMQERSCVQDAQTQDTYKCLAPGSYYVQVFTPKLKNGVPVTGTINLNLSSVVHVDSCAPIPPCLANANFQPQYDCNTSDKVTFVNYSTFGSAISYNWDFGYNGQTSNAVSPQFTYPALATAQTYTVTLTVNNSSCAAGGVVTYTAPVTIPGRPAVNLGADTSLCTPGSSLILNATTWPGSTYQWENGITTPVRTLSNTGVYHIAVTYNGCTRRDTVKVNINTILPIVQTRILCGNDSALLNSVRSQGETYAWNTGATSGSIYASAPGLYINNVNWRGCIIKDSFNVSNMIRPFSTDDTTRCFPFQTFALNATVPGAQSYQWQNGSTAASYNVTTPGQYWVNVNFGSCAVRDTINVSVSAAPQVINSAASICAGSTYALPWGGTASTTGMYYDTIPSAAGCDSVRRSVNLMVQNVTTLSTNAVFCAGQSFTLPWGQVVTSPGIYRDTLHYISGCDSIRKVVNVTMQSAINDVTNAVICAGETYTLANGTIVNTTGVYNDTLHYATGCDSIRRTVNLTVQPFATQVNNATMCPNTTFTLPWGAIVNTPGIYHDTLHYATGCDSIRRTINLSVQNFTTVNTSAVICAGQTYTLPWGQVVNTPGTYNDTLHYVTGCDSVRRTVNLVVQTAAAVVVNANICAGESYTLPWGQIVNTPGIYLDTLHYATGCDSIRRTVNLTQQNFTTTVNNVTICNGQSYTLPWGQIVNSTGTYNDTLHYSTGCDSIRRTIHLTVQNFSVTTTSATICAGSTYTLPWGQVVSAAGTYNDTLHYVSGCDSIRRTVNLTVQQPAAVTTNANICIGQTYTLPWGAVVSAGGVYNDTLHYTTGCDSIRRTVNLTVQDFTTLVTNATICIGQNYTTPWGSNINTTGAYHDTLHYVTGCDSIRRTINLTVQNFTSTVTNATICAGQNYTLPWGAIVNSSGIYQDTLHYTTGCDSIRRTVNLLVQFPVTQTSSAVICAGQNFTLPWGAVVNSTGIYRDTLHYATGCDSIRRVVSLTVQAPAPRVINATICAGITYTLPTGVIVNTSGSYYDTLYYATGCDSIYRTVNLTVTPSAVSSKDVSICSDQNFTLPWGQVVNTSGSYIDTVRTPFGCDSLIRRVNLTVLPVPDISISKANDLSCALSTTKLSATGAASYVWSPAGTLSDPYSNNPKASPTTNTTYTVTGTASNGCKATKSITVNYAPGPDYNKYLVPSSFTPNGDGLNDCFGVPHWGRVSGFSLAIYNRYGYTVFKTSDPSQCWDGRYKGVEQNTAAFVYIITANGACGPVTKKGTVLLIR